MKLVRNRLFRLGSAVSLGIGCYLARNSLWTKYASMEGSSSIRTSKDPSEIYNRANGKRKKLSYKTREQHLKEVESTQEYDVIVVGGGATGAGVAINTSAAGLKTLVIEAQDFGTGTSSKSTKLLHGGYRYFQQVFEFNFDFELKRENLYLVQEGVEERDRVVNNAPHITRYLGLALPCRNLAQALYYYCGIWMYYAFSLRFLSNENEFSCPSPKLIGQDELRKNFPLINSMYNWAVVVYDGEMNDTRMLMEALLTASQEDYRPGYRGANILNYAKLEGFLKDDQGKITGIEFLDKVSGKKVKARGKVVVNATGNFSDYIRKMDNPKSGIRIVHSQGSHVMLDGTYSSRDMGLLIPKTTDGRVMFILPWLQGTMIGTTDYIEKDPNIHPIPTNKCLSFIENEMKRIYPAFEKEGSFQNQVRSQWSGIRPLVLHKELHEGQEPDRGSGKNFSRIHMLLESDSGLISVIGGKWTIFRRMGEDTLKLILKKHFPQMKVPDPIPEEVSSRHVRFIGDYRGTDGIHSDKKRDVPHSQYVTSLAQSIHSRHSSLSIALINHLVMNYGSRCLDIIDLISSNPSMAAKIHPNFEVTKAEVLYQIRTEMVVTPIDLLLRRNRLAFLDRKASEDALPWIVDTLGDEKKWSVQTKKKNLEEAKELFSQMKF